MSFKGLILDLIAIWWRGWSIIWIAYAVALYFYGDPPDWAPLVALAAAAMWHFADGVAHYRNRVVTAHQAGSATADDVKGDA